MSSKHSDFIKKLEEEAKLQAGVHRTQILPKQVGGFARLVAKYPWQTIAISSCMTALILEVWR